MEAVMIDRRFLLTSAAFLPVIGVMPRLARADVATEKVDYTLRIGTGLVELAPDHIVSTTLYNGQFPGPLLRFTEGQRVVVNVYNDTDTPQAHRPELRILNHLRMQKASKEPRATRAARLRS